MPIQTSFVERAVFFTLKMTPSPILTGPTSSK